MDNQDKMFVGFILLVFLVLTQVQIFVIDRESWFDESFSLQTAYNLNNVGWSMSWVECLEWFVLIPSLCLVCVASLLRWGYEND